MTFSGIYQSGVARSSEVNDANLSVNMAIIGSNEYSNLRDKRDNSWYIETVTPELIGNFSEQAIAFASLGEISPQFWSTGPSLDERMSWDQDRDGIPDENAPSWLGPVNLAWKIPYEPKWQNYSEFSYQNQYPLYMVRFWEDDFLNYVKEEILFYQQRGWDGIFFDTVPPTQWTEVNELHSSIYSWDELANNSYYGLKKIRDFIDSTLPGFKLFINGSALVPSWMNKRPDVFHLLDGVVLESKIFYGYMDSGKNVTHGNEFPAHFKLKHWRNSSSELQNLSRLLDGLGVDIPVLLTEYVDDLPEIAAATAISMNGLDDNFSANLVYDSLFRSKQDSSTRTLAQNYVAYVGGDGNDQISNTSNARSIIVGGDGDDVLVGSNLDDVFMGGSGNNIVNGGDGFDIAVYDLPFEAYVKSSDMAASRIELKSQYKHQLEITLYSWTIPDNVPKFSLFVNDSLVVSDFPILSGEAKTFKYWSADPITSVRYININGAYFPEYESAIGTSISQILVDDQQLNLSDAAFLDGKEEWAGYDQEYSSLNPGYGNVYFDTSSLALRDISVDDELRSVERIIFSDELISRHEGVLLDQDRVSRNGEEENVWRLFNQSTGRHLFGSSNYEKDLLTGLSSSEWIYEGTAYDSSGDRGSPLHRFFDSDNSVHFYTANDAEKELLINSVDHAHFIYEGEAFNVLPVDTRGQHGLVDVVRYFNSSTGLHLYSTSLEEQYILAADESWIREGVAWCAFDPLI